MSIDRQLEEAQLLARFKLQVKRSINESVDLERLTRDREYARRRLAEIEEAALDEELLIMVLRLRDLLVPAQAFAAAEPEAILIPDEPETPDPESKETRNYLLGARAW